MYQQNIINQLQCLPIPNTTKYLYSQLYDIPVPLERRNLIAGQQQGTTIFPLLNQNIKVGLDLGQSQQPIKQYKQDPYTIKKEKYYEEFPADYLLPIEIKKYNPVMTAKERERILGIEQLKFELKQQQLLQAQKPLSISSSKLSISKSLSKISVQPKKVPQQANQFLVKVQELPRMNRKTKILRINLIFLNWYLKSLNYQIEQKKLRQHNFVSENLDQTLDDISDWFVPRIDANLLEICNWTDDLSLKIGQDSQNAKTKQKISKYIDQFFVNLSKDFKPEEHFKGITAKTLNIYIQQYNFPPENHFLKFEAFRLRFYKYGSLKETNTQQKQLIIIGIIVFRQLLFENILELWKMYPDQQNQAALALVQKNSLILASILHDSLVAGIKKLIPLQNQNLDKLKAAIKIREYPLSINEQLLMKQDKQFKSEILIDGLLAPNIVNRYIYVKQNQQEEYLEKVQKIIIELTEKIVVQLDKEHQENKPEKVKVRDLMMGYLDSKKVIQNDE
ncbi:hypothetical protein pb186bvf_020166 [Paramecium bursaria]